MEGWRECHTDKDLGKGKGIKIAVIDSGINTWHPHIQNVVGGIALTVNDEGRIELSEDITDRLGHGTAVAGILSDQVPEAEIYAVKVFNDNLFTHAEVLCAAIEWCMLNDIHIINLSLSLKKDVSVFREMCDEAEKGGIVLVSSCDRNRGLMWPGSYSSVFGVERGEHARYNLCYYNPNEKISFQAYGLPRELEGPMQKYNLNGHSFAAAYVTSYLAKLIEQERLSEIKGAEKGPVSHQSKVVERT